MQILRQATNKQVSAGSRDIFIPFSNERDNIGRIIQPKLMKKTQCNAMKMFENLKKSTDQYFFEKKYEKMVKRFTFLKKNLERQSGYDYPNSQFEDLAQKSLCFTKTKETFLKPSTQILFANSHRNQGSLFQIEHLQEGTSHQSVEQEKQEFFIDLQQKINKKIQNIRKNVYRKSKSNQLYEGNKTNQMIKKSTIKSKRINQNNQNYNKLIRPRSQQKSTSQLMQTFCKRGRNYKYLVEQKKFDPWKKWYNEHELELFPGKKIKVRLLQKSIYA